MAEIGIHEIDTGYSLSDKQVRLDWDDVGYCITQLEVGDVCSITLNCANGSVYAEMERSGRRTCSLYFAVNNDTIFLTDESGSGVSTSTVGLSSYALGNVTSIDGDFPGIFYFDTDTTTGGGNTGGDGGDDPGTTPEHVTPNYRIYTLLNRIITKLSNIHEKLDYCIEDIAGTAQNISSTGTWTSSISGVTISSSSIRLVGNMLLLYCATTISSSASISTGSQTADFVQVVISKGKHEDPLPRANAKSHWRLQIPSYLAFPGGAGQTGAKAVSLYTVCSNGSADANGYVDVTIKFKLSYVKVKPTALRFIVAMPVVRCDLDQG